MDNEEPIIEVDGPSPADMPEMPDTLITPFAMGIHRVHNPQGGLVYLVKVFTPAHTYTIQLNENQAKKLAETINSGLVIAQPGDIAKVTR